MLEKIKSKYINDFIDENTSYADSYMFNFMQEVINTFNWQQDQINELKKKVKKLEQAKTYYLMTENKHRALLNNCVDDDEAILHKREIKGVKR